jgi:hypothetical protein
MSNAKALLTCRDQKEPEAGCAIARPRLHFAVRSRSVALRTTPTVCHDLIPSVPKIAGHFGKLGKNAHVVQGPVGLTQKPERDPKRGFLGRKPGRQLVSHI